MEREGGITTGLPPPRPARLGRRKGTLCPIFLWCFYFVRYIYIS